MSPEEQAIIDQYKLTDDEVTEMKEAFSLFDKNGDGHITQQELGTVVRALGQCPTDKEIEEMLATADESNDGKIDFCEFLKMTVPKRSADPKSELMDAFKVFDRDGSGKISRKELKHIMCGLGESASEHEIDEMMGEADVNNDGEIDYAEFCDMMTKK